MLPVNAHSDTLSKSSDATASERMLSEHTLVAVQQSFAEKSEGFLR